MPLNQLHLEYPEPLFQSHYIKFFCTGSLVLPHSICVLVYSRVCNWGCLCQTIDLLITLGERSQIIISCTMNSYYKVLFSRLFIVLIAG